MNPPNPTFVSPTRAETPSASSLKWWGGFVVDGNPPQRRFVLRWRRILGVAIALGFAGYLVLVTALWGYFTKYRKIPGVNWVDIAVLPRFSRVQTAVGDYYYVQAKQLWEKKNYIEAITTARAALVKSPRNLEARLFLAQCWYEVARYDDAIRTLKDGIAFQGADPRLQKTLVDVCLFSAHFQDLLTILREDLPARGIRLLEGKDRLFQLAELRAVLEMNGPAEAETIANSRAGLSDDPAASPLLARIDWELNRQEAAFERLRVARERAPQDPAIHDGYVDTALRLKKADEARAASVVFLSAFPNHAPAQLRFLEAHGSRKGPDERPWLVECMRFLAQYQHTPAALGQLASLAASQGWTDLTFLLYQNSLHNNLTGFPFVSYYIASLLKTGEFAAAESAWRELSLRNAPQLAAAPYLEAMVASGLGHESEALQIVERLRRQTENNRSRRKSLEQVFRTFGFPKIADALVASEPPPSAPE